MPIDIGNLDPITVSMRDYVDGITDRRDKELAGHDARHRENHASHEERHVRDHTAHEDAHRAEQEAIDTLAALVAAQRTEDAHTVEVALEAVQRAAQIHAQAHEQQHSSHQAIHDVEKEAIAKAAEQLDKRLESMNGVRAQLRDQNATFISTDVFTAKMIAFERERDDFRNVQAAVTTRLTALEVGLATKAQAGDNTGRYALAIIGFAIAIVVPVVVIITNLLTTP